MNKILVGFALLMYPLISCAENTLVLGAYYKATSVLYCQSVEDAAELAKLYVNDIPSADTLSLARNREARCSVQPTSFSIVDQMASFSGPSGTSYVVKVEVANGYHYIITNAKVVVDLSSQSFDESEVELPTENTSGSQAE